MVVCLMEFDYIRTVEGYCGWEYQWISAKLIMWNLRNKLRWNKEYIEFIFLKVITIGAKGW